MKKVLVLLVAAGMLSFMACGGGKDKEKAAKLADSLKKDSLMKDSISQAEKKAESLKQIADSLKKDSVEKAKKGGKVIKAKK